MKRVSVLGSTGSVGVNTLDVLARHPDRFEVFALSASTRIDLLFEQLVRFKPRFAVMASAPHARELAQRVKAHGLTTEVLDGASALDLVASHGDVDIVMAAIVGAAGLGSCMAAARAGKRLLLANKEALVVGGEVFLDAVRSGGATLLPIDSEHSAIFQALPEDPGTWRARVHKIILTASGGPFRTRDPATFGAITPEQACAHPNWKMGRKISVDSATMMNKALELIEARHLFGLESQQLEVVIHPQSVVHSMVQYLDSSIVAQLGSTDMRVPIAYGLSWPERIASGSASLDFGAMSALSFESIEEHGHSERFPGLSLASQVMQGPQGSCAVLNGANEVAVQAFLDRRLRFDQIHQLNLATLEAVSPSSPASLDDLLELDRHTREVARGLLPTLA
jgi:1-deoxy-D-xylulose-5-phosphate reductoisomerase